MFAPLQGRYGAFGAGLVIGVVAAVWHVIPFAQVHPSVAWILGQCLFTVAFRVVIAWIYSVSGRSLFAAVVCHAAYNTAWQLFPNQGSGLQPLDRRGAHVGCGGRRRRRLRGAHAGRYPHGNSE